MILYTLYKNSYLDIKNLETTKGITCYVNSTNRCPCSCTFCLRQTKEMIEGNTLWLKQEPTVQEIIAEFSKYDLNDFKEVVFCGFGEPLVRHDDLMEVARYLKDKRPDLPIRVNTNGLASIYHQRDITPEFKGLLDTVSISLNASNKEEYYRLTRSQYGLDSYNQMLDFTAKCRNYVPNVVLTIVDILPPEDIKKCQEIADNLKVKLRIRPYEE